MILSKRFDVQQVAMLRCHEARADRLRKSNELVLLGMAANESTVEKFARTRSDENRTGSRHIA